MSADGKSGPQNIVRQTIPNLGGQGQVNFIKSNFDAIIEMKGYRVYHDKAIKCPCKVETIDHLSNCQNCGGSGWVFYNRIESRMILRSMNLSTQYKDWSELTLGTVNLTARDVDKLGYMDRVTVIDARSAFSETIYLKVFKGVHIGYVTYDIVEIEDIFMFASANSKLTRLIEGEDYSIRNNAIILTSKYDTYPNVCVSLRYIHSPMYHVIDLPRDTMVAPILNNAGVPEDQQMPVSAVARRAHYVLDAQNYVGDYLFDNSYLDPC
jgi:hypothetical protein